MPNPTPSFDLYYWPSLPGRGEYVRLVLEEAGVPYRDIARLPAEQGGTWKACIRAINGELGGVKPLAPPILQIDNTPIAQTSNICLLLAKMFHLVPDDPLLQALANQMQLSLHDLIDEVHDTHHPTASSLRYEEQMPAAKERAAFFCKERIPKFLHYFEHVLTHNTASQGKYLVGHGFTYVDLSLFHTLEGLTYAFPRTLAKHRATIPALLDLSARVQQRPRVEAYLQSPRRLAFGEDGIFRYYPELESFLDQPES